MLKDDYEILLLEFRQGLKDKEQSLKCLACVDLFAWQRLKKARDLIQQELINYRVGSVGRNKQLSDLMGGGF